MSTVILAIGTALKKKPSVQLGQLGGGGVTHGPIFAGGGALVKRYRLTSFMAIYGSCFTAINRANEEPTK
jgi:hypothetical protein